MAASFSAVSTLSSASIQTYDKRICISGSAREKSATVSQEMSRE